MNEVEYKYLLSFVDNRNYPLDPICQCFLLFKMSRIITTIVAALAFWPPLASTIAIDNTKRGLSYSDVSVSFDVLAGARDSMPLNRQLISLSIEYV